MNFSETNSNTNESSAVIKDKVFIVVLGDVGNWRYRLMHERLNELGNVREILDNVFLLVADEAYQYEELRNIIAGSEYGYCMIISTRELRAAWNIEPQLSSFLSSFFKKES